MGIRVAPAGPPARPVARLAPAAHPGFAVDKNHTRSNQVEESTMGQRMETWVVVLAGGDGTRLSALTKTDAGDSIPKQFCSLDGGPQLLEEALQRAQRIVPRER